MALTFVSAEPSSFTNVTVSTSTQPAQHTYRTQGFTDPERQVNDQLQIENRIINVQKTDEKTLKLILNEGKNNQTVLSGGEISVPVHKNKNGANHTVTLRFQQHENGSWTYRNTTELVLELKSDRLVALDLNGNGTYGEAVVDGLTWYGSLYCFPFPAPHESIATEEHEITSLQLTPFGKESTAQIRPIKTGSPETRTILKHINRERVRIGLTPRPEDRELSGPLQKHCQYMAANETLTHGEKKDLPKYTKEGHKAGNRSILVHGREPKGVADNMMRTYYHRLDLVRPDTLAFGLCYKDRYAGIDGRGRRIPAPPDRLWPYRIPAPRQQNVPVAFQNETPDPINGDRKAGYPITMYFQTTDVELLDSKLVAVKGSNGDPTRACYTFDPGDGKYSKAQKALALIPEDPLEKETVYRVTLKYTQDKKQHKISWKFATEGMSVDAWETD